MGETTRPADEMAAAHFDEAKGSRLPRRKQGQLTFDKMISPVSEGAYAPPHGGRRPEARLGSGEDQGHPQARTHLADFARSLGQFQSTAVGFGDGGDQGES